jgi:S-(hydroxymethyl)mycothiol dehydrogenase
VAAIAADPVGQIRRLTDGFGADIVLDAAGRVETRRPAFYAQNLAGTVVLVGAPAPQMRLELALLDVFGRGGPLKSSCYGGCLPSRDFPMLVGHYLNGRLPLGRVRDRDQLHRRGGKGVRQDALRCCARSSCSESRTDP